MSSQSTTESNASRSRMGWMLKPYVGLLAAAVILLVGLTGVNILVPQLIGMVFDQVIEQTNRALLWVILAALLLLFVVRNLLYFYSKYSAVRVGEDVAFDLRNRLFERLQQMNLQYYRTNKPGNLSSRVMNDSFAIQTFIQDELPKLAQAVLLFVGLVAAMYATNWQLAMVTTIVLPVHLLVFHYFKGAIKTASKSAQQHMAEATGNLIEKFLGMEVVKGFTAEHRESRAFEHAIDASRQSQLKSKKYHVTQKIATDLLIGLGMIGLIGFGAYQVMGGRMTAGALITFFIYVKEVNPTVMEMMSGFAKLTKTSASVDRINDVLQTRGDETAGGGERPEIHGRIAFEHVSFSYPDSTPVLRQITFEVEPGEVCAIVGHSGAGKSTLVNLVPRFHDPDAGRVLIDGADAREIDRQHLRRAVGIAFQECFLFNSTILENLRYARPRATRDEIIDVAKRIGADEFIVRLPQGYDTMVGENGVTLSRGQKQLINLARAMLKSPTILILDEATASIDEAREQRTMQAILEFMKGKTTLMITHRPEMLQHADKVLQLVDGEVAYFGPPPETPSMLPTPASETPTYEIDFAYRPDRPEEPVDDDDRPEARPSGSGIWRGIKALALAATLGAAIATPAAASTTPGTTLLGAAKQAIVVDRAANAAAHVIPAVNLGTTMSVGADDMAAAEAAETAAAEAADAAEAARAAADRAAAAQEAVEQAEAAEAAAEAQAAAERAAEAAAEAQAVADRVANAETSAEESATAARTAAENAADRATEARLAAADAARSERAVAAAVEAHPAVISEAIQQVEFSGRGQGEVKAMPGVNDVEAQELLEVIGQRLQSDLDYRRAPSDLADRLPDPPAQLRGMAVFSRTIDGEQRLIQLAYRTFVTQPTHLWLYGVTVVDGEASPNEDLDQIEQMIDDARAARDERVANLTVADLATRIIPLSYAEPGHALGVFKSMGYATIEYTAAGQGPGGYQSINPSQNVDPANLPIIMVMPASDDTNMVGGQQGNAANFPHTSASPLMELMVLYDPGRPEQFAEVRNRVQDTIDKPARQVLIEAMVLEVSETGLQELGVQWRLDPQNPFGSRPWSNIEQLTLGRAVGETATFGARVGRVFGHFDVQLQALIQDGEAEILSRPSVLTLDNRQASINVGERIPIARSIAHARIDRLEFNFEYIDVGIFLNLRPRVASDGNEVSMQITGEVSAEVPGQALEIIDPQTDQVVGFAPRISERRVQTYSRIANNTPFIIGGLIQGETTEQVDKVPLLGDIPFIKHLFRRTQSTELKREVIIVITPYVLSEEQVTGRHIPKDEDAFDSFGHELFRDAYRIRDEDVFDLTFLTQNPQLQRMQQVADRVIARRPDLEHVEPFSRFANRRIPGERALVYRQMYEVINRLDLHDDVDMNRIIYFYPQPDIEQGFSVGFVNRTLPELARKAWFEAFPDEAVHRIPNDPLVALQQAGKAVAMTYTLREEADELLEQPVVDMRLIDMPDRSTWSRRLWELNQPDDQGRQRHTLIIHSERDLHRLRSALVLEKVVELNASDQELTLRNFTIGRQLLMPALAEDQMFVLDADVAMYFFMTEQYYPALQQELQRQTRALQEELRRGGLGVGGGRDQRGGNPEGASMPAWRGRQ